MQDTRARPSTGFRRRCAAWRVTFLCVAKEKSPKERPPPLVRPPASGSLGSPVCPTARADGPSLAQRRSLGILPRGLDKRAHLGEQQGHALTKPKLYFPNPLHCSPLSAERAVNMNAKATGGHGIGSPCKSPSRVQRVRSAIRDDGAAGIGAKSGQGEHCSTPIWRENKDVRSGLWPKPGMV